MKILKLIGLLYCLIGFTQTQNETLLKHLDSVTTYVDRVVDVTPGTSVIITKNNQTFLYSCKRPIEHRIKYKKQYRHQVRFGIYSQSVYWLRHCYLRG